jgi:endo-beta-N-acetylglucosaminidase D
VVEHKAIEKARSMGWAAYALDDETANVDLADTGDHMVLEYYPETDTEAPAFVMWYGGFESEFLRTNQELKREYNRLLKLIADKSGLDRV